MIYFHEAGSGKPIVFLHGFCDNHKLWSDFISEFTNSYRVLTPDLPGFGQSTLLPAPFTIDDVGDAMAQWFEELGLDRPIVIGHSLGGYVALSLLARHSNMVSGIGLFHSTPFDDSQERKKIRDKVIRFVELNGVEPFIDTFVPGLFLNKSDPQIDATRQRCLTTKRDALVGYARAMRDRKDRTQTLQKGLVPLLVIAGMKDSLIPFDDLKKLAEMTPNCEFFGILEAAHMGIFEAKKQCQTIISGFTDRIAPIK
jgi:pimeloyl-ACP methyl ester carboxylesterase